ncbi:MAG TPA: hypothetical protein VFH80_19315 [Solirubrobacteraceae bacterium]|nr:hypothetical protein [Solirubrobacteraceae bacterium]
MLRTHLTSPTKVAKSFAHICPVLTIAAFALALIVPSGATAAPDPSTPVQASAAQVAQYLFVAGDVGRLSQIPSGTEDVVLEKVLQQLYAEQPTLPPATAVSDIQGLQTVLSSGSSAVSTDTLTVMGGNERTLAILRALTDSSQPAEVEQALAQVTDHALVDSVQTAQGSGSAFQAFHPSVDTLSTLDFTSFSPAQTLAATASLAAGNHSFGVARDDLWNQVSHESVFDDTGTLLGENPALHTDAIKQFTSLLGADGTLTTTVGQLEQLISGAVTTIGDQNCKPGGSPGSCSSGALANAQAVSQACQGSGSTSTACTDARNRTVSDGNTEVATIAAERAATAAEGVALGGADQSTEQIELDEGQAAAQLADDANQAVVYATTQQIEKTTFDAVNLAVSLSVSEVDPVAAVGALLNVIGDATGFAFPDPTSQVLQGLETISGQISDFEQYTAAAFKQVDERLAGLSSQIAGLSGQIASLGAQLGQIQDQLTNLQGDLSTLQSSVDHLQSELQTLFQAGAENDLQTNINTYLGYVHKNGHPLTSDQFNAAAEIFYTDATKTAVAPTVLSTYQPSDFSAAGALNPLRSLDVDTLDTNINYFNYFPGSVADSHGSPVGWPDASQDLTSSTTGGQTTISCAANAQPDQFLCLPNPDFWASATRAYTQLLTENPQYVNKARLDELQSLADDGKLITGALQRVSANDAGSDPGGTGSKLLDDAINYWDYWGASTLGSASQPSLYQALRNEERHYLAAQGASGVNPWGGISQSPDLNGLVNKLPQDVPPCPEVSGLVSNPDDYRLPYALNAAMVSFLPSDILNAARLGVIRLSACYTATFNGYTSAQGGPFTISLRISDGQGDLGKITASESFASGCGVTGSGDFDRDGIFAVKANCNPTAQWLANSTDTTASGSGYIFQPNVDSDVAQTLSDLQTGVYKDLISDANGSSPVTDPSLDIAAAAKRLGGANALLDGYISLGLPQALASDDVLHSFVAGQNVDAFAPTQGNPWDVKPATDVAGQIVNFYTAAIAALPSSDPTGLVPTMIQTRATALNGALHQHIVASGSTATPGALQVRLASGIAATSQATGFAEDNPVIGPTLDRIDETHAALADADSAGVLVSVGLAGSGAGSVSGPGLSCSANCSHGYTAAATKFTDGSFPTVTLTATPATGSTFAGWSGACSGTGPCTLPIGLYDQAVTATFVPATGSSATGSSATGGSATQHPGPTVQPGSPSVVRCTLAPTSAKVLLPSNGHVSKQRRGGKNKATVQPGTVSLTVSCNQNAKVALTGTLSEVLASRGTRTAHAGRHVVHYRLGPARASAKAGRRLTLTVKLPAAALQALAKKISESAVFTLTAVNSAGTRKATATIMKLTPR